MYTNGHKQKLPAESPIDEYRPMKVICIGAGMSGILTGIRFPQRIKNLDLVIYDKNEDLGGTWFESRYPGIACDIPSHSYQFTFANNPQWSEFYASGAEIQRYLKNVAKRYDVMRYMKLRHEIKEARWHADEGKWKLKIINLENSETFTDEADVLISATGILSRWAWPDIPGLHGFQGKLLHSANWKNWVDPLDATEKKVAVIGGGSTGVQIVPQIQPLVSKLDHYMKGKTWISPVGYASEDVARRGYTGNFAYSDEELKRFREVPGAYLKYRHEIEGQMNAAQLVTWLGTEAQKGFWTMSDASMREKLAKKPEIYESLRPSFPPGCRRLTPGPGYLEALVEDNVEFISCGIDHVVPEGIVANDGNTREVDIIICATGYDTSLEQQIPIIGENNTTLGDVWDPTPQAYLSICPPKMPNFFMFLGPNGAAGGGSNVPQLESVAEYMIKCIQKLQAQHIKSMVASDDATTAFIKHVDRYFAKTVWAEKCKSWFKRNVEDGRVVTLWPGSQLHAAKALESVRFEDFRYELMDDLEANPLSWLGTGTTVAQDRGGYTTSYLDTVDIPPPIVEGVNLWEGEDPYPLPTLRRPGSAQPT